MKETLQLRRIEAKLNGLLCPKIDMSDLGTNYSTHDYQAHLYSRALAALAVMKIADIDADVAAKSVTDGYNDMGIDAVYNDSAQKKLILVQSKWRGTASGGIDQNEMLVFVRGIRAIIDFSLDGSNDKLLAKSTEIENALNDIGYQLEVVFCHTGTQRCSSYVKEPILELIDSMNDDGQDMVSFSELILSDVYKYLAAGNGEIDITLDDVLVENWGCVESPIRAYYGVVSAEVLGRWYMKYGNKLFDKNIRYYKGSTDVNNGIQEVLQHEADKFYYYNNGVKLLCNKIDRKLVGGNDNKAGLFHLEGVSLVNGAQTTGSIGAVYQRDPTLLTNAKILIQMIDLRGEDEDSARQITRLTNTQNRIDSKDFASLDPQQERIKEELLFDNIHYFYKSGAGISDPDHQILFEEAIVAQACASGEIALVHLAKQNVGALTEDISRKPYTILFNTSTNSRALVNNVRIMRLVERYLQNRQKETDGKLKSIVIHGNRILLYLVLKFAKGKYPKYDAELLDYNCLEQEIDNICENLICQIQEKIGQENFNCPYMMIFKSLNRTKALISLLDPSVRFESGELRHIIGGNTQLTLDLDL